MEELLEENNALRKDLGHKHAPGSGFPDGRFKSTPRSNHHRRTWERLDERETNRAPVRDRSTGQRSTKSNGSSGRAVRYQEDDLSDEGQKDRKRSESNVSTARKSSGSNAVAFERTNEVITVPVMGVMRPSRSRVSTPFFSEEAVNKVMIPKQSTPKGSTDESSGSSSSSGEDTHSQVNFEPDVHVVEVLFGGDSDETGSHHSRSVRGRIATPFIHDVPTKDLTEPKSDGTTS